MTRAHRILPILLSVFCVLSCSHGRQSNKNTLPDDVFVFRDKESVLDSVVREIGIKMISRGGVYEVPCSVNGVKMNFVFDTGASSVCISTTEANFLYKNGYLQSADIIGESFSEIADGSLVANLEVMLNSVEIGGVRIEDVQAIIVNSENAPLLLGQSALKRFGGIRISGDSLYITAKLRPTTPQPEIADAKTTSNHKKTITLFGSKRRSRIDTLLSQAQRYYDDDMFSSSQKCLFDARRLNPRDFRIYALLGNVFLSTGELGYVVDEYYSDYLRFNKNKEAFSVNNQTYSYSDVLAQYAYYNYKRGNYDQAQNYAQEAIRYEPNNVSALYRMGQICVKKKEYDVAERWAKKLLAVSEKEGWFRLGVVYGAQGRTSESIKAYKKAIELDPDYGAAYGNLAHQYSNFYDEKNYNGSYYPPTNNKYYISAVSLHQRAARLGYKESQKWLQQRSIDW